MVWVLVLGAIALAALIMLVGYGVWLAHKASDVLSEVTVLGERTGQLAGLLAQIEVPSPRSVVGSGHSGPRSSAMADPDRDPQPET